MSDLRKIFADYLKAARKERSQTEFAAFLGVVQQSYSRYERGTSVPDVEDLLKIASKLQVNPAALIGGLNWGGAERDTVSHREGLSVPGPGRMPAEEGEMWKRRAEAAEEELSQLKARIRSLLDANIRLNTNEPELRQPPPRSGAVAPKPENPKPNSELERARAGALKAASDALHKRGGGRTP